LYPVALKPKLLALEQWCQS